MKPMSQTSHKFSIWGMSGSGKTTYICSFLHEINKRNIEDSSFGWHIPLAEDEALQKFMNQHCINLAQGKFPRATDPSVPYRMDIHLYHPQRNKILINIMDIAGELITDEEDVYGYFSLVRQTQGIMLFFNSKMSQNEVQKCRVAAQRLANEIRKLDSSELIQLAFCVTQIDREEAWNDYQIRTQPNLYLKDKVLGRILFEELTELCPKHNFFSLSSIGRYKDKSGQEVSNISSDGSIAELKKWKPDRILAPFFWLINSINS